MPGQRGIALRTFPLVVVTLLALHAVVWFKNAWVGDDAYITFRTVDNFVHGYGLRYNIDERVQSYTHPLWMFVVSAGFAITGEPYYTSLALSLLASLAALWVLAFRIARRPADAYLPLGILLLSKAFVDYESSGLENPLTHLLLALFCAEYFRFGNRTLGGAAPSEHDDPLRLGLLASAIALTRMDTVLFVVPALAFTAWSQRKERAATRLLLGALPFVAWEAFSFLYYGSFVPNTAYAKLSPGIPRAELIAQGLAYLASSLKVDPITPVAIAAALGAAAWRGDARMRCIAAGTALYLAYSVAIGGCFMSGRLLSAPVMAAALLITRMPIAQRMPRLAAAAAALALGLSSSYSPLYTTTSYGAETERWQFGHGIIDERGCYFPAAGLVRLFPGPGIPKHRYTAFGLKTTAPVLVTYALGYTGFFAPRTTHVMDPYGLADPLLARLPVADAKEWRIGHFLRAMPPGYEETLIEGRNLLEDPALAAYYDMISSVTRDPIFDARRLRLAWRLALGFAMPPR